MVPKRAKELYKVTAEKLNISEDLVKDAVQMYWSDVRKALGNMEYHFVYVDNLGTFKAKEQRLRDKLVFYERLSKYNDGSSFRKMAMKNEQDARAAKIKKLLELIEQDKIKKQLIKVRRDGQTSTNLEEPISDIGGSIQHDTQEGGSRSNLPQENEDMQSLSPDG